MNWNSASFFRSLTESNVYARRYGFVFRTVSGLEGFHSTISGALKTKAMVAVCDTSEGAMEIDNTPHTRRVKTVFLFMRHPAGDDDARLECMNVMRELFRQFMSVLVRESVRLEEHCIYVDPRISFTEVDRYFFLDGACAFFQIAVENYVNLEYNESEWLSDPMTGK